MEQKEVFIVETVNREGYGFEKYNGTDEVEARRIYNEFSVRKMKKVELYKKITLECVDNNISKI